MALSSNQAHIRSLVAFKAYAKRRGARVSEALPEGKPRPVHSKNSFHYDTAVYSGVSHSRAADINHGKAGISAAEMDMLKHLRVVAESMGLGVILAEFGTVGSAAQHRDHLHVDTGSYSNTGKGSRRATPGDLVAWDTQPQIRGQQDNLAGAETKKRLMALREASKFGGNDFPYGVKFAQSVVGAKQTGTWDADSRKKHDATVKAVKTVWKNAKIFTGTVNTTWDSAMEAAYRKFLDKYGR